MTGPKISWHEQVLFMPSRGVDTHKCGASEIYTIPVSGTYYWIDQDGYTHEEYCEAGERLDYPVMLTRKVGPL